MNTKLICDDLHQKIHEDLNGLINWVEEELESHFKLKNYRGII